jgi:hypothetical protein
MVKKLGVGFHIFLDVPGVKNKGDVDHNTHKYITGSPDRDRIALCHDRRDWMLRERFIM